MGQIIELPKLHHDRLPGVTVYPIQGEVKAGLPQEVLVDVEPGQQIPLHRHGVDATMFIASGSGEVLSEDKTIAGRSVSKGDVVFFERNVNHGFRAGAIGLVFISRNGGIVSSKNQNWDITFLSEG